MSKIKAFTANEFSGFAGFLTVVEGHINCGRLDVQPSLSPTDAADEEGGTLSLTAYPASDEQPESFRWVRFSKNEKFPGQTREVLIADPQGNELTRIAVEPQTSHQPFVYHLQAKILEVTAVKLHILKRNPPVLLIQAEGTVSSSGWKNGKLIPFVYVAPPADGIYEFDFVAEKPAGTSLPVVSTIATEGQWEGFPSDLRGIRIYASSNNVVKRLNEAEEWMKLEGGGSGNPKGLFVS